MLLQDLTERYHFQPGDHTCVFYRDDDELLQIVGPYLLQGLRSNQRCFTAQRESFISILVDFLDRNNIDVIQAEKNGQLEIYPADTVYFSKGVFDRVDMCATLRREIEKTVEAGFKGLRTAGDLVWLDDPRTVKEIIDYEYLINHVIDGLPVTCMCQYPVPRMSSALHDALMQHHSIRIRQLGNSHYGYSLCNGEHIVEISADGDSARLDLTLQKLGEPEAVPKGSALSFNDALASARRSLLSIVSN
jgi:hypothetical protein